MADKTEAERAEEVAVMIDRALNPDDAYDGSDAMAKPEGDES